MILDRIEWDEHHLDHATRRLTAAEMEQAIWNARSDVPSPGVRERALFRSVTDVGKQVVAVVEIVHAGGRPITGWEV